VVTKRRCEVASQFRSFTVINKVYPSHNHRQNYCTRDTSVSSRRTDRGHWTYPALEIMGSSSARAEKQAPGARAVHGTSNTRIMHAPTLAGQGSGASHADRNADDEEDDAHHWHKYLQNILKLSFPPRYCHWWHGTLGRFVSCCLVFPRLGFNIDLAPRPCERNSRYSESTRTERACPTHPPLRVSPILYPGTRNGK
jgi:hypothetical protein